MTSHLYTIHTISSSYCITSIMCIHIFNKKITSYGSACFNFWSLFDPAPRPWMPPFLSQEEAERLIRSLQASTRGLNRVEESQARDAISVLDGVALSRLGLRPPERPQPPRLSAQHLPSRERLYQIQQYITSLTYNHTSKQYYNIRKNRSLCRILETARDIVREGLPIRCIEAVFLGLLLTSGQEHLDRYPVGFKTMVGTNVYRHIVLVVHDTKADLFGALGLSRRDNLMYKPLHYATLSDVVADYIHAYHSWWHAVHYVRVGLPAEHNEYYAGT